MQQFTLRPGRDEDAAGIIALIARCWADYPGCVLDVDRDAPMLRALATYYAGIGGALWVAEAVEGMIAVRPVEGRVWEICRVYVHPDRHGSGLAAALLTAAETHAMTRGAGRMELWSDVRFRRAHRFYEKHLYKRGERRRPVDEPDVEEWCYSKAVSAQTG